MRVRAVLVSAAAVVLAVPMVLASPGAAFAIGHPVDPATLNPPPTGGDPVCAREGTRIQCWTTEPQVADPVTFDSGISCGGVDLLWTATWTLEHGVATFDSAGDVVDLLYVDSYTGSFANPVTGRSVSWTQQDRTHYVFSTPGDTSAGTSTMTERQQVRTSTGGLVLTDAGTETFDLADGARLSAAGHHPLDDSLYTGDASGVAPLCAALA